MPDIDPASRGRGGRIVTIHELDDRGKPTVQLGTATIISPDAVVLDFDISTLTLPLGVVAPADVVEDVKVGSRLTNGHFLFDVATIHIGKRGAFSETDGSDGPSKSDGPRLALEITGPALRPTTPPQLSARSFWCILFPHLQACIPRH